MRDRIGVRLGEGGREREGWESASGAPRWTPRPYSLRLGLSIMARRFLFLASPPPRGSLRFERPVREGRNVHEREQLPAMGLGTTLQDRKIRSFFEPKRLVEVGQQWLDDRALQLLMVLVVPVTAFNGEDTPDAPLETQPPPER